MASSLPEVLAKKDYLSPDSCGPGWAYDLSVGGRNYILASGEDINAMVFDTEMYSNTGGQASKASNIDEVCPFVATGKEVAKKALAEIARDKTDACFPPCSGSVWPIFSQATTLLCPKAILCDNYAGKRRRGKVE